MNHCERYADNGAAAYALAAAIKPDDGAAPSERIYTHKEVAGALREAMDATESQRRAAEAQTCGELLKVASDTALRTGADVSLSGCGVSVTVTAPRRPTMEQSDALASITRLCNAAAAGIPLLISAMLAKVGKLKTDEPETTTPEKR